MEALAIGITESVDDDHIRARVGQVEYLGEKLEHAGIPVVLPIGGHAVLLDARRILPNIPQERFPAQALTAALYLEVRRSLHGAWHGVGWQRQGDRRELLA